MNGGSDAIERIFAACFRERYATVLVGGGDEPLYLPGEGSWPHRIVYRHDYVQSAFHEVAHWCIAGPARRQKRDYGYWYAPDGRTDEQQASFEQVEVAPQALEWVFSDAWGSRFELSADNLGSGCGPSAAFAAAVAQQRARYHERGMPRRAATFAAALARGDARAWGVSA
ncbi:MAG: elongation factor P hydroxylase [Polyangiaceae bacterium]